MRKFLFYFTTIIIIIFFEILFPVFSIFSLLFVAFIGLYKGSASGCTVGFFIGLVEGVFSASSFGVGSFSYSIVGYLIGRLSRRIDEDYSLVQISIVFLGVILSKVVSSIIEMLFTGLAGVFNLNWTIILVVLAPIFFIIFKKWWFLWFKRFGVER
jgi:rod shape-determining protein MreD